MSKRSDGQKRGNPPVINPPPGVSCDVCNKPDDSRMVACDTCEQWYHFACVSVDSDVQERDWSCGKCLEAATKDPTGTSTPLATSGAIPKSSVSKQTEPSRDEALQKQLAGMQKRMKEFERMMKEKDDQRLKELKDQRKKYDQELKDTERRVLEQVERQHRLIRSGEGGSAASSTGNQPVQSMPSGGSTSSTGNRDPLMMLGSGLTASLFGNQPMQITSDGPTAKVIGNQPLQWPLGAGPTASPTGNPLPQIDVHEESQYDILVQELRLLQEKRALERQHLEERRLLLQRYAKVDGGAAGGGFGLNPQVTAFQTNGIGSFGASPLNQSHLSARQAVNKDLPIFSGNPEEWPLFLASYENSTRI